MSKVREELDATAHGFCMSYQQCPHFDDVLDSVVLAEVEQMMEEYAAIRANAALEAAAKVIINLSPSTWARGTQVGAAEIRALKGKQL